MTNLFAYKLLTQEQWLAWKESGTFAGAPIDVEDGYVHLSTREQVRETAEKYFADIDPLILVMVDLVVLGRRSEVGAVARRRALPPCLRQHARERRLRPQPAAPADQRHT